MRFVPLIIASFFSIIWAFIGACVVVGLSSAAGVETPSSLGANANDMNVWEWIVFVYEVFLIRIISLNLKETSKP